MRISVTIPVCQRRLSAVTHSIRMTFGSLGTLAVLFASPLVPAQLALAQTPAPPVDPATETAEQDLALEPFSVYVAHDNLYARCGPSEEYYRTDPLRLGQRLDVYAETDDGWLGIRPPADSFCWIPADTVQLDATQNNGTIIEDRTVAWIGTHLGRARSYRWQVQLAKGEPITILGRSEREGPDGPQMWFRIVPPSGEYRWVHREQVVFSSEELVAALQAEADARSTAASQSSSLALSQTSAAQTAATRSKTGNPMPDRDNELADIGRSVLADDRPIGSGLKPEWQAADAPSNVVEAMQQNGLLASVEFLSQPRLLEIGSGPVAPQPSSAGDENWVAGPRTAPGNVATTNSVASTDWTTTRASSLGSVMPVSAQQPAPPKQSVVSAERIALIESEVQNASFDQLSLIFARLMAAQATAAEIEPVARAAGQLAAAAPDAVVAGRARLLAERAEQYRRLATRRDGESVIRSEAPPTVAAANYNVPVPSVPGPSVPSPSIPSPSIPSPSIPGILAGAEQAPLAATQVGTHSGYLVQVYSARRDSPPFALTDKTGRTVAYATPAPGVNLRVHLNSQVTLTGKPGFLTGLNLPHLVVTDAARTPE